MRYRSRESSKVSETPRSRDRAEEEYRPRQAYLRMRCVFKRSVAVSAMRVEREANQVQ